jgi:hypothetical protein
VEAMQVQVIQPALMSDMISVFSHNYKEFNSISVSGLFQLQSSPYIIGFFFDVYLIHLFAQTKQIVVS